MPGRNIIMKKDLLSIRDLTRQDILDLLSRSHALKKMRKEHILHQPLKGKTLALIFAKPSTRTRISFEVGMNDLGGHSLFLAADQLQIGRGETPEDSARVLSRYLDGMVIRTFDHQEVLDFANNSDVPVINGLTDLSHPVQILADLFSIEEKLGRPEEFKIAYVGDSNNVSHSWILAASLMNIHLTIASPKGYQATIPKDIDFLGKVETMEDPIAAVKDADVIYTDVWFSMGQEEAAEKEKALHPYQINQRLVDAAKNEVLVMHCLPAHREMEITSEVLDGPRSIVFDQAENRLHVQKAILEKLLTPPTAVGG
jgi:ornithine carbamoyltransferase